MLTIDTLKQFGADTAQGLGRCLNNEEFYFRLIAKAVEDDSFEKLEQAIGGGDLKTAFELSHSLKGVMGNLSLTPIYEPVAQMTELLRASAQADYGKYIQTIMSKREELKKLL